MSASSIDAQITDLLKEAMRNKDQRTKDCLAMIKTKHMEKRTSAGFKGELNDALWIEVISAYQKQVKKSREEFAALGDKGAEEIGKLDFEIEFCARFLPKAASEDETRTAVREAMVRMNAKDPKMAGKIMGDVMKTAEKGKFDPAVLKRVAEEELTKAAAAG